MPVSGNSFVFGVMIFYALADVLSLYFQRLVSLANSTMDDQLILIIRRFMNFFGSVMIFLDRPFQIAITYDTPVNAISAFVEGLKKIVVEHPNTRKDYYEIHLNKMASSSLNILFYIFFKVPSWSDELACRHQILLEILKLTEVLDVRFAFPTQTLHMETFPGQSSLTPESF